MSRSNRIGTVYLICFSKKLSHAKHYIGWTEKPLEERIADHKSGKGAKILAHLAKVGIPFKVVKTWENETGHFEQKLKRQKNSRHHCPNCGKRKRKFKTHKELSLENNSKQRRPEDDSVARERRAENAITTSR
jgi:predicted GIY-YIG superfamily endonuclease